MSESQERNVVLACAPVSWTPVVNSTAMMASCDHEVWIAEAGRQLLANEPKARVVCVPCGLLLQAIQAAKGEAVEPSAVPGALAEIEKARGTAFRDEIDAFMRKRGIRSNG